MEDSNPQDRPNDAYRRAVREQNWIAAFVVGAALACFAAPPLISWAIRAIAYLT